MPIRAEMRDRYPPDWPEISLRVREEAKHRCEKCGVPHGALIRRGRDCAGRPLWRFAHFTAYHDGFCAETGARVPDTNEDTVNWGPRVKVVLTVAHLDHRPENVDRANLRAWCQRCHNAYDAPMRRAGIAQRRRAAAAVGDLIEQ